MTKENRRPSIDFGLNTSTLLYFEYIAPKTA